MVYDHDLAGAAPYMCHYIQFKICPPAPLLTMDLNLSFIQMMKFKVR
jgi:hypothetical protein